MRRTGCNYGVELFSFQEFSAFAERMLVPANARIRYEKVAPQEFEKFLDQPGFFFVRKTAVGNLFFTSQFFVIFERLGSRSAENPHAGRNFFGQSRIKNRVSAFVL